jgi:hypothetical protein
VAPRYLSRRTYRVIGALAILFGGSEFVLGFVADGTRASSFWPVLPLLVLALGVGLAVGWLPPRTGR